MYHFVTGYTCKMAGTEIGVTEPEPIFSACYGEPFLIRHPALYAEMLAEKVDEHGCKVWMINTGWVNGKYGTGQVRPSPLDNDPNISIENQFERHQSYH